MDQQYPTVAKIPEVIEFGDSYVVHASPLSTTTTDTTSGESGKKSGRTVTLTAEDMQKKKNDDNLNQKFLTSLAPEWLMHTINRGDLDTMSLDDLYNHLKVSELEYRRNRSLIPRTWPLSLQQNTAAEMKMPPGFQDPKFPAKVYKVEKAMYGLHQALRAWYGELNFFLRLQVLQKKDGIFLSQDKYVGDILKKFGYSDVRPDIMFAVCACARHQVTPKECHLHAVKRIFRYLKGHPKLGLWLISWKCKKQTIMATSTTEAEYVAAASCCGQVLWIQNQLLDYGYNFMNTKIDIDNNSAICIVKNPVYHSKTKHIKIRHHFIRDCFEKKLISVDHIHTDENVADLLTKPFDTGRFQYLVCKLFPLLGKLSTVSVFLGFGLTFP
nr:hypothetical protein [Tanacetum cinerariifolium]